MRKGGGKSKGSAFERVVCKLLSMWVSGGRRIDLFWRTAMSGGRATVARRKGVVVRQAGDITAVSPKGHSLTDCWCIECKAYRKIDLEQWLVNGQGKIARWWAVCKKEAREYGRDPMLIVKQNGWPALVITRRTHVEHWAAPLFSVYNHGCDVTLLSDMLLSDFGNSDFSGNIL